MKLGSEMRDGSEWGGYWTYCDDCGASLGPFETKEQRAKAYKEHVESGHVKGTSLDLNHMPYSTQKFFESY